MKIRLASPLQTDSIVDGEGIRAVVWTQGCPHHCPGCHNPGTHDFGGGYLEELSKIKKDIKALDDETGVTFSGGDPFMQAEACTEIAKFCHERNLNVWCYTGFTLEEIFDMSKTNPKIFKFLEVIDVLVDGRFEQDKKSMSVLFRGSTNQRIIDVAKSIKAKKAILIEKYVYDTKNNFKVKKEEKLYI